MDDDECVQRIQTRIERLRREQYSIDVDLRMYYDELSECERCGDDYGAQEIWYQIKALERASERVAEELWGASDELHNLVN